jgi:cell division protein FtsL
VVVVAVVTAFVLTYYPVAKVQYRETREEARLQSELNALKQRNARLRRQVATLRTPEGVEDFARSRLGLVKPGEHVVVVTEGTKTLAPSALAVAPRIDSDEALEAPSGPWTAFLDRVFGVQ